MCNTFNKQVPHAVAQSSGGLVNIKFWQVK